MTGRPPPSPIVRPSTSRTGTTPAKVPVTKASSAPYTSVRLKLRSCAGMPAARAAASTVPRVIPPRQNAPDEVHTSPRRTMKKCVELQVATKPWGSSIRASSAPAV